MTPSNLLNNFAWSNNQLQSESEHALFLAMLCPLHSIANKEQYKKLDTKRHLHPEGFYIWMNATIINYELKMNALPVTQCYMYKWRNLNTVDMENTGRKHAFTAWGKPRWRTKISPMICVLYMRLAKRHVLGSSDIKQ